MTLAASLEALWRTIGARARTAEPRSSYTARLLAGGIDRVAQKVGEEATETVIAGVREDRPAIVTESADLLYHLLVLWRATGVEPEAVAAELEQRARRPSAVHPGGDPRPESEKKSDGHR